jgi:hypothetical protein
VWQNLEFTVDFLAGGWVSSAMPKSTSLKYETRWYDRTYDISHDLFGVFRGNGTVAGKVTALQIQSVLQPITSLEEVDGVDISPKPMDSCDAGQLESCAIER